MEPLTRTELAVLKAIFERNQPGYVPIHVPGLDRPTTRAAVARLLELGLIDAARADPSTDTADEWMPGDVTASGQEWLRLYGLKRP